MRKAVLKIKIILLIAVTIFLTMGISGVEKISPTRAMADEGNCTDVSNAKACYSGGEVCALWWCCNNCNGQKGFQGDVVVFDGYHGG